MNKGYVLPAQEGVSKAVIGILKTCLDEKIFEAVLVPVRSENGTNYVLLEDPNLLEKAEIMPPVMSVQGGRIVQSLTRHGKSKNIAVVMRLCEIKAAIELAKLRQTNLENVFFVSMDCPGVMPLSDYLQDRTEEPNTDTKLRPLCQMCDQFSLAGNEENREVDLYIGTVGMPEGSVLVIPVSAEGKEVVGKLGMEPNAETKDWAAKATQIQKERKKVRQEGLEEIKQKICGLDGLLETFSKCIQCHNCRNVCPICYCRVCFADKPSPDTADAYLQRAASNEGVLRFPPEPLLFHLGRMSHIGLSCVSCGMCEDVCPVDIPVGRIFSLISETTQSIFDYLPGRSTEEALPFTRYQLEELSDVEDR
jgi:formate dehydrogenase subunit beta